MGDCNDFEDIVNYWNLRAADIDLLFFDQAFEARLQPLIQSHLRQLREGMPVDDLENRIGIWSKEGRVVDLASFGANSMRIELREGIWSGSNLKPPLMFIEHHSALGAISDSRGVPSLSFELRPKPFYDEPGFHNQDVVVSVRPLLDSSTEETTFRYPFIPELNRFYGHEAYIRSTAVRAGLDELGIITSVTRNDLTIHSVSRRKLVSEIFAAFGMKAEPSDAGRIAMRLIQQMGGIQGCRAFKITGVRALVEKYNPLQAFTRSNAVQTIGRNDPATGIPQFEPFENLFIEPRKGGALTPHQVFDFLLKRGVFRVGLNLVCPNCELQFWMHLDDVKTEIGCEYCGRKFDITTQLKDRCWGFRRSGLFGKDDHQQGAIPVAVTLQQIDTVLHSGAIYVTGMNIAPTTTDILPCETDFVVIGSRSYHAGVEFAIGECKSRGEITEDDVMKLSRVADQFPSRRIEAFIVFAKTAPFTPEEVARCRAAQPNHRRRVILLSDRELEPYFVYERTEKEFVMHSPTAISLNDLARATHEVYFDPRRRTPV